MRRVDDLVAVLDERLAQEVLDDAPDAAAVRVPQHETGTDLLLDGEEVEALAEHAVVAFLGLFQAVQVFAQVLIGKEGGAVDALEHLAAFVAPPVRARHAQELEVPEAAGAGDVGATAEVEEGAVAVDGDDFVLVELVQAFELEGVVGEEVAGLCLGDDLALEGWSDCTTSAMSFSMASICSGVKGSGTSKS